jgi:DNA-binding CsgD family transcriptional regulator
VSRARKHHEQRVERAVPGACQVVEGRSLNDLSGDPMVTDPLPTVGADGGVSSSAASPLLQVMSESIRALDDGRPVHEVMCLGLAHALSASAAAFVRLDRHLRQCVVVCWSAEHAWASLSHTTRGQNGEPCVGHRQRSPWPRWPTLAPDVLCDLAGPSNCLSMELAETPHETRLVVLGRLRPFHDSEAQILAQCQGVMSAIDRHAFSLCRPEEGQIKTHPPDTAAVAQAPGLTNREMEVLSWLYQGMKAAAIARRLGISPRTVNKHLANIYRKLGAHDRLMAVSKAQSLGVLPHPHAALAQGI